MPRRQLADTAHSFHAVPTPPSNDDESKQRAQVVGWGLSVLSAAGAALWAAELEGAGGRGPPSKLYLGAICPLLSTWSPLQGRCCQHTHDLMSPVTAVLWAWRCTKAQRWRGGPKGRSDSISFFLCFTPCCSGGVKTHDGADYSSVAMSDLEEGRL